MTKKKCEKEKPAGALSDKEFVCKKCQRTSNSKGKLCRPEKNK